MEDSDEGLFGPSIGIGLPLCPALLQLASGSGPAPVDNWVNESSVIWTNESAQNWTSS